ncbi:MAG: ribosome maturation factor RimM [Bacilli bacterium]|jgi:16S rRNA processing protein RimM|nr:ribosome maturation factor RimM [Bacilli bacterium]
MDLVKLAEIGKTVGLKGDVRCYSLTDFPSARFKRGQKLYVGEGNEPVTVERFRDEGRFVVLAFKEWPTIEEAEKHLRQSVSIAKDEAPLPKGYYRLEDLKGCEVADEKGAKLGVVSDVLSYAPVKTLRVKREGGRDFFVPFLMGKFVLSIDLDAKRITIKVMDGLL